MHGIRNCLRLDGRRAHAIKHNLLIFLSLLLSLGVASAYAGSTYYTDTDNENNAGSGVADNDLDASISRASGAHPIEFNLRVTGALPTTSAFLTLRANDVDEEEGEQDDVYFNGVRLGKLSGTNDTWNTTAFEVPLNLVHAGNNKVTVDVDTSGDPTNWVLMVDWGQLVIDGGAADKADATNVAITGYSISGLNVIMNTRVSIAVALSGNYRAEINLIDPAGNNTSVLSQDFIATAGQTVSRNFAPSYPLASGSGRYTIQAQLFYDAAGFPLQQDVETLSFDHATSVGPGFANATVDASPTAIAASGTATSTIIVGLRDARGNVLTGSAGNITLATTLGTLSAVTNHNNGTYSATLSPDNTAGLATITGRSNGVAITDTATVRLLAGPVSTATSTLESSPATITADGSSTATITVQLRDANGAGQGIGGANVALTSTLGTLSTITDHDNGSYSATLTAPTTIGNATLTGSVNGEAITDTASVSFVAGSAAAASSRLSLAPGTLVANGTSTSTVSLQLRDAWDNPVTNGGATVAFTTTLGALSAVTDHGDGSYSAIFTAPASLGALSTTAAIGASVNGLAGPIQAITLTVNPAGDEDGDGRTNAEEGTSVDSDHDGIPDYLDDAIDTDSDSIPDIIETDRDSDDDGTPDFRDTDSDNDGLSDALESGLTGNDADADGIDDALDVDQTGGLDANHDGIDDNAALTDHDDDHTPDVIDTDSDNDGVADSAEIGYEGDNGVPLDTDGDGVPDHHDLDSDNDSLPDVIEAGLDDENGDALADPGQPLVTTPRDSDGDGVPDLRDLDSNNDGRFDIDDGDAASLDQDDDGRIDPTVDADGDGIDDAWDDNPSSGGMDTDTDTDTDNGSGSGSGSGGNTGGGNNGGNNNGNGENPGTPAAGKGKGGGGTLDLLLLLMLTSAHWVRRRHQV